jgi:hypothetical protein
VGLGGSIWVAKRGDGTPEKALVEVTWLEATSEGVIGSSFLIDIVTCALLMSFIGFGR